MQHRRAHRALSVFLAFVLICTCNSATFQPLAAFAVGDGAPALSSDDALVGTVATGDGAGLAAGEGAGVLAEDSEGEGLGEPEAAGEAQEPAGADTSRASGDVTERADVLALDVTGATWRDAAGLDARAEVVEGTLDLAAFDAATGATLTLAYRAVLQPGMLVAGDTFAIALPLDAFALDEDRLVAANADTASRATVAAHEGCVVVALTEAAATATEPVTLEVRVPVQLREDAPALVNLSLPVGRTVSLTLPAQPVVVDKPEAAPEATIQESLLAEDALTPKLFASATQREGETNWTNDLNQLLLGVGTFSYKDKSGTSHEIKGEPGGNGKEVFDFSSVPFASIDSMMMEVVFKIQYDDEKRQIKEGDYYEYALPSIFTIEDQTDAKPIVSPMGDELATYTIESSKIKVVFTRTVDIEEGNQDILGGVDCTFGLNKNELGKVPDTGVDWRLQSGGTTYSFKTPNPSTELKGIEKTGVYHADTNTVTWTIKVGTDAASAGVPLKGVEVTDAFDKATQTITGVTGPDGTDLVKPEDTWDGLFTYTFPDESTAVAPYEITVTAKVADGVLLSSANADQTLANNASLTPGAGTEVTVPPDQGTTGNVPVLRYGLAKEGTQIGSNLMAWELVVNKDGVGAAKNVIVYDRLDARAELDKDSLQVNGKSVQVLSPSEQKPITGTYAVLTPEDGTSLLEIHFGENVLVSTEQRITFDTRINVSEAEKNQDLDFPNGAWITYEFPNGPGVGEVEYAPIPIKPKFQVAYLDKETPSYDPSTGIIDWTIEPSMRTETYTTAVVTDVVNDDQEFLGDSSVKVLVNGADRTSETYKGYSAGTKTLRFEFPQSLCSLDKDKVKISYQSQALNFLNENWKDHVYQNTAHLDVYTTDSPDTPKFTAEDTAERTFRNEFLKKTSDYQVVDDNGASASTGYLHYRITVNANHMQCTNLKVQDNLTALATNILNAEGKTIDAVESKDWTIADIKVTKQAKAGGEEDVTSTFGTTKWISSKQINAVFPDGDASYVIDLRLTLDKDTLAYLNTACPGGFVIQTLNTATASADEFDGGAPVGDTCTGVTDAPGISEKAVGKSATFNQKEEWLDYRVDINPNGLNLQNAVLTDMPDNMLELDANSVELFYAKHDANGAISQELGAAVPVGSWTKQLVYDAELDKAVLKVTLPDGTASFVLTYHANVVGQPAGGKVKNDVTLTVEDKPLSSDSYEASVDSGSWGWLTKKAAYKLLKVDEFGGNASPLAGVTFALYGSEADAKAGTNPLKTATSNKQGIVSFYGLEGPTHQYWYKEVGVPQGYQEAPVGTFTTGELGSFKGKPEQVKNARTVGGSVEIMKSYESGDTYTDTSTLQSRFTLWLYPNGFKGGKKVKVPLEKASGGTSYAYDADGTQFELTDEAGQLNITGLPWGDYGVEEVEAPAGYTRYKGLKQFSISREDASANYALTGTAQDVGQKGIENKKTQLKVVKTTKKDSGFSLKGAKLSVYDKDPATNQNLTPVTTPFGVQLTIKITNDTEETWDLAGISAGTYWLVEDNGPTNPELAKFNPVKFTVDEFGAITKEGTAELAGTTLKVRDDPAQVTVKKLDQWDVGVVGAELQVQKQTGTAWDVVETWTTTAEKTEKTFTLERGVTYRIVETKVPDGYTQANHDTAVNSKGLGQTIQFDIDQYGKVTDVKLLNGSAPGWNTLTGDFQNKNKGNVLTLRNERIVGHAEFVKFDTGIGKDAAPKPLAGVSFDLYQMAGSAPGVASDILVNAGHFVSDVKGKVTTVGSELKFSQNIGNAKEGEKVRRGLPAGTYYFKEVATHNDFAFDAANPLITDTFTINKDTNRYTWPDFSVARVTSAGNPVANAPLNAQVRLVKQDADLGTAVVGATFELRDATTGKVVDRQKTAAAPTVTAPTTFTNTVKETDSNDNTPTAASTLDGELFFVNIPAGEYKVVETVPAPGYQLDGTEYPVVVAQDLPDQVFAITRDAVVKNKQNHLSIEKVGVAGHSVAGTEFELAPVDGAKFARTLDGKISWTVADDLSNNPFDITGELVAESVYKLSETKPAPGYTLAADVLLRMDKQGNLSTSASDGGTFTRVADNKLQVTNTLNEISLKKVDQFDRPVARATFELSGTFADGTATRTWNTSDSEMLTLTGELVAGEEYTLHETTVPDGFISMSDQVIRVTDRGVLELVRGNATIEGTTLTAVNKLTLAHAKLVKTDEGGKPFTGATFSLYKQGAGAAGEDLLILEGIAPSGVGAEWTTDDAANTMTNPDTGLALKEGLATGAYYFGETATANDRYLDTTHHAFALGIGADGTTVDATVQNVKMNAAMTLTKVDATSGDALAGVSFKLTCAPADGSAPTEQTLTTNNSGVIIAENLVKGDYTLTETDTDANYVNGGFAAAFTVSDACQDKTLVICTDAVGIAPFNLAVTADADNLKPASLANKRQLGTVTIEKLGVGGALPGVTFEVRTADGNVVDSDITDEQGKVVFADLTWGDYYVVETAVPDGYVLDATQHEFTIGYGSLTKNFTVAGDGAITNTQTTYTLAKFQEDGATGLAGATFEITGTFAGKTAEETRTLLAGAQSQTETGLLIGGNTYTITETVPPAGYQLRPPFEVTMGKDGTLALVGTPEGVSLEGNTIKVTDEVTELSFDKEGLFVESCSDPVLGAVAPDATLPLAGAEFTTFIDEACTTVAKPAAGSIIATSDENGHVLFRGLAGGTTYYVKETKAPEGHVLPDTVYQAVFATDGTLTSFTQVGSTEAVATIVNDVIRTDISIKKVSEMDPSKVLPGSTYGLFKRVTAVPAPEPAPKPAATLARASAPLSLAASLLPETDLQLIATATTDENGVLAFKGVLMNQEYIIQELVAPDGSLVSKHPITMTFETDESGTPKLVKFDDGSGTAFVDADGTIVWREPQVVVEFSKKDVEGRLLAGAKLQVVDASGTVMGEPWTSSAEAPHRMEGNLSAGETYRLVEVEVPAGYERAADVEFTVESPVLGPDENYVQHVEMIDQRTPVPPRSHSARTGDTPLAPLTAGIALVAAGIAAASTLHQRRKQR